jgi:sterol desaturase/sphingolipid hydroxylase (fatty acid hydroxylase superfamily)
VIALGATPAAVILFEIILNATALFNHANLKLPLSLDKVLRLVLVTPDMHRIHHSVIQTETDRNFGFNIPLWDRLFGSYCAQPQAGHADMQIGLSAYRGPETSQLGWSLVLPFRARLDRTPSNKRREHS